MRTNAYINNVTLALTVMFLHGNYVKTQFQAVRDV